MLEFQSMRMGRLHVIRQRRIRQHAGSMAQLVRTEYSAGLRPRIGRAGRSYLD